MKRFCFSGTLGDAFIVYCKLYNFWTNHRQNVELFRYSCHVDMDKPISEFFSQTPFIKYITPCFKVEKENAGKVKYHLPYINIFWNGHNADDGPDDPVNFDMDPYPNVFILPDKEINKKRFNIGLQLHSGKAGYNFKGFSLKWIKNIRNQFPKDNYNIYLFGTGEGYQKKKIDRLCTKNQIFNFVGKTDLIQWLSKIMAMDYFITPEGFSAFFAMSQKVPVLAFYRLEQILRRVPPGWRKNNIIMCFEEKGLFEKVVSKLLKKEKYYSPLEPRQIKSLIKLKI